MERTLVKACERNCCLQISSCFYFPFNSIKPTFYRGWWFAAYLWDSKQRIWSILLSWRGCMGYRMLRSYTWRLCKRSQIPSLGGLYLRRSEHWEEFLHCIINLALITYSNTPNDIIRFIYQMYQNTSKYIPIHSNETYFKSYSRQNMWVWSNIIFQRNIIKHLNRIMQLLTNYGKSSSNFLSIQY